MTAAQIDKAMVLAAGLGTRMRPITDRMPKPLVAVAGRTLIDRSLDLLVHAGVRVAIVNVHYLADQLIAHLQGRRDIEVVISDEREELLDSAGGIVHALPHLGGEPFYVLNADTFWLDGAEPELGRMAAAWQAQDMDILLMLVDNARAHGHAGMGDFTMSADCRLARATGAAPAPIYAGAAIIHPRIFAGSRAGRASLNRYFDRAIAEGRLYGMMMQGRWITVGTPGAIAEAEDAIACVAGGA